MPSGIDNATEPPVSSGGVLSPPGPAHVGAVKGGAGPVVDQRVDIAVDRVDAIRGIDVVDLSAGGAVQDLSEVGATPGVLGEVS